jgi:hypothetical protein
MVVFSVLMPVLFGVQRELTFHFLGRDVATIPVLLLGGRFRNIWSWWYFAVTAACTLSPVLGWVCVVPQNPRRGMKLFLLSAVPNLSLLVMSTAAAISYMLSRQAVFLVTGDRWGVDPKSFPEGYSPTNSVADRLGAEDRLTLIVELALGITFTITCVFIFNFILMAYALALMMGPFLLRFSWSSRPVRPFLFLPFLLVCFGLLLDLTNLEMVQGAVMSIFPFHF